MKFIRDLIGKVRRHASNTAALGLLVEFSLRDRAGPVVTFMALSSILYLYGGWSRPLAVLVQLWLAYSIAFTALALLALRKGVNVQLWLAVSVAIAGIAVGGMVAAIIGVTSEWWLLADWHRLINEWLIGASFATFFIALSLITSAVNYQRHLEVESKRQLMQAQLRALQSQIEPHFLMNTLANVRFLVKSDPLIAATMLDHLADFLQGALQRSRSASSTLEQELDMVRNYMSIMRIRLKDRLNFEIECPGTLLKNIVPPLLLQPLVENAICHGLEPSDAGGSVNICVSSNGIDMKIVVADDGVGIEKIESVIDGVGLRNIRERLASLYQGRASFELRGNMPRGTAATLIIPIT